MPTPPKKTPKNAKRPGKKRSRQATPGSSGCTSREQTPNSLIAFDNLKKICAEHLDCRYRIEVIDLLKNPQLAKDHQIIAVPTLIRKLPTPVKKIIGNLSNTEKVLVGLDLQEGRMT